MGFDDYGFCAKIAVNVSKTASYESSVINVN